MCELAYNNKYKYFKIIEFKTERNKSYVVCACRFWISQFIGDWDTFAMQNKTIEEAKIQIEAIKSQGVKSSKKVNFD